MSELYSSAAEYRDVAEHYTRQLVASRLLCPQDVEVVVRNCLDRYEVAVSGECYPPKLHPGNQRVDIATKL